MFNIHVYEQYQSQSQNEGFVRGALLWAAFSKQFLFLMNHLGETPWSTFELFVEKQLYSHMIKTQMLQRNPTKPCLHPTIHATYDYVPITYIDLLLQKWLQVWASTEIRSYSWNTITYCLQYLTIKLHVLNSVINVRANL